MTPNPDKILSASRRTDIPAFYLDWFMEHISLGFFNIKNPFTHTVKRLDLSEEKIHSIVFWSKNYETFIKTHAGEKLQDAGYHLYFNFTINSESDMLEPNIPPLKERLGQLRLLARRFGSKAVDWRFDPICFYQTHINGPIQDNLNDFQTIAQEAQTAEIKKCVISFCDPYAKIKKRIQMLYKKNNQTMIFSDPSIDQKKQVVLQLQDHLKNTGIQLHLCCEKQIFSSLDQNHTDNPSGIFENACVDGKKLKALYGGNPETRRDYGQRSKKGCHCSKSIDVGSYKDHPCFHNCLFCYANPDIDTKLNKMTSYDN